MRWAATQQVESGITWEECPCPSCAGAVCLPQLLGHDGGGIARCPRCDLCFTNPRPNPASIHRYYPSDYHCHRTTPQSKRADRMERLLAADPPGRLLDFGCGAGGFLVRMRRRGWNVVGLDQSADIARRLGIEHGLTVHAGTLPDPEFPDACFDAITMRQALEHVHAPLEVLRDAHRLLTANGRLLVSVPNFDALAAGWFGRRWHGLDLPRHLTHFTPDTLRAILSRAGFPGSAIEHESHPSWIRHSARTGSFLRTRLGSGIASRFARLLGRGEALLAVAVKE